MGIENKGFTLIEFLVVMGIMATVGTMVVNLFLSNLRTAAKTQALTEVKQNGDYALAVMERMIRNAKEVQENSDHQICVAGMSKLKILNPDGGTTEFTCEADKIASGGAALTSSNLEVDFCTSAFSCQKPTGKPAVVTITFTLRKGTTSLGREFFAEIPFQTTVSTRLY